MTTNDGVKKLRKEAADISARATAVLNDEHSCDLPALNNARERLVDALKKVNLAIEIYNI